MPEASSGGGPDDAAAAPREREPDYRFTLANERTFLAWIRTSLGLLAAGVAVRQLVPPFAVPWGREVLALACVLLAVILGAGSYPRWRSVQRAMRRDEPLPTSWIAPVLATAVLLVAGLVTVLVLLGGRQGGGAP
ncbi:YidH family protein [Allostreptomyces psammosilenae]|uniref:Putative membrane protein n=1 Tax=Allostreptomyces psammosilenae TaxID=1892865 RepID=A0A853A1A0_9ACTN|nr:DUF202 domain-containing protein [Allostreptomyces psammosilenae]NYI08185.1 putative membrane protein [Allostreptomyces psammosilenae]